jgi:hypothetical protein
VDVDKQGCLLGDRRRAFDETGPRPGADQTKEKVVIHGRRILKFAVGQCSDKIPISE